MRLRTQVDMLVNQLGGVSRFIPVKGLFGSWLTPDRYQEGGALEYKVMGRTQIYDSITINTIYQTSCLYALPVQIDRL
jgi:hypothetical protein